MHPFLSLLQALLRPAGSFGTALILVCGFVLFPSRSLAQLPAFEDSSLPRLWELNPPLGNPIPATTERIPRLRLFRITPGFLADPIGLQDDDSTLPGSPSMAGTNL